MAFVKYSSPTGIVNFSFAVMWVVVTLILIPTAAFLFFAQLPWLGVVLLALAGYCVWQFRVFLRDGRAELSAYRAGVADRSND